MKSIFVMRHAEREDRYQESIGNNWINTAERPQDPPLSMEGIEQVHAVGKQMLIELNKLGGITYNDNNKCNVLILSSPMIRTLMTADIIANELNLNHKCICIEPLLVEGYHYMRGNINSN